MKRYEDDENDFSSYMPMLFSFLGLLLVITFCIWGCCAGGRVYDVWAQGKEGQAELAKAESNRQIKTLEARAKMEGSKHLADAEIIRAKGVAEANRIIGESLKGNECYLRYLWIQNLADGHGSVIYVPTEANLPILEANRLK